MSQITLPIYNTEGKEVDSVKLDAHIFDGTVNTASMYQVINAYRANQRRGLAATKTRGEVSGGGKKPWRQKGTGRARAGSTRSPLWRHGGVVFGPHPRDFSFTLPKKLSKFALRSAINEKIKQNNLIVLDTLEIGSPKTKEASRIFSNLKINPKKNKTVSSVLLLLDKTDKNLLLALRNIGFLKTSLAKDTNTYEVLSHDKILVTKKGIGELTERLKK